ncbi:MAG TPA: FAD-binding oxidoreductase [Verrucomicrobiales bacterium]|nr:FAD-binding oxidoreductase [Verrucomicrobiales bacterium]
MKKKTASFTRRGFVRALARLTAFPTFGIPLFTFNGVATQALAKSVWPTQADWDSLRNEVKGRLIQVTSPLKACQINSGSSHCAEALEQMKNPFFLEGHPGATQSTGWLQGWKTEVSPYAVAAESPADIVAAVNFVRKHGIKLVIKGTGHDYLGRSNAPDSLLVWTHKMRKITVHEAFTPTGGNGPGVPAVTVEAGTRWLEAYDAVTNQHGRYVQGGGCTSVGVAGGFIQGGGFGSFSKKFGIAAASMLEAEVVTADGLVVLANEFQNKDLFWALKGGGGGTFGIVARLTLLTHELPENFGIVQGTIRASSDRDFQELLEAFADFYTQNLGNEHWGEQVKIKEDNSIDIALVFQGLSKIEAQKVWQSFLARLESRPQQYTVETDFTVMPASKMWDYGYMSNQYPHLVTLDKRKGQPSNQFWWTSNQGEVSRFQWSYQSRWLPLQLFKDTKRCAELFFRMSRHHSFSLHLNKGQAGATPTALERGQNTSINPAVFNATALIIANGRSDTEAYPDIEGHKPDLELGREVLRRINAAMKILRDATPGAGSYSNETDYHEPNWQEEFWGTNYPRLLAIKRKYDPQGLFQTHHSVGSEL